MFYIRGVQQANRDNGRGSLQAQLTDSTAMIIGSVLQLVPCL